MIKHQIFSEGYVMTLGERIKKKRKDLKLTQKELAKLLGIDHTTISKWESNIYEPDTDTLQRLADIFDTTIDYLIGRSDINDRNYVDRKVLKSNLKCSSCGITSDESYLEAHHIVPIAKGGNIQDEDNVVVLCPNCHRAMHQEELRIIEEIKKHPVMFHDLKTNPEKKIKQLIKMWKFIKEDLDEEDDDEDIIDDF
nr:helix-turn-helix domain-containing protein [Fredinandcohnia onubensis]